MKKITLLLTLVLISFTLVACSITSPIEKVIKNYSNTVENIEKSKVVQVSTYDEQGELETKIITNYSFYESRYYYTIDNIYSETKVEEVGYVDSIGNLEIRYTYEIQNSSTLESKSIKYNDETNITELQFLLEVYLVFFSSDIEVTPIEDTQFVLVDEENNAIYDGEYIYLLNDDNYIELDIKTKYKVDTNITMDNETLQDAIDATLNNIAEGELESLDDYLDIFSEDSNEEIVLGDVFAVNIIGGYIVGDILISKDEMVKVDVRDHLSNLNYYNFGDLITANAQLSVENNSFNYNSYKNIEESLPIKNLYDLIKECLKLETKNESILLSELPLELQDCIKSNFSGVTSLIVGSNYIMLESQYEPQIINIYGNVDYTIEEFQSAVYKNLKYKMLQCLN